MRVSYAQKPRPEAPRTPASGAQRVALIVAAAFFMQNLDGVIIATSLPQMASAFRVRPADLNIGITAYMLSTAAFVPLSGWVADRLGAKRVFAGAIVIFTLASLACGFAQDLWQFTAARIVQGLGGALMTPVGRVVVLRSAEKADLLAATALLTWPALIAPVIGPVLGGFITTYVSWRWNFFLNAPLGAVGVALVLAFVPGGSVAAKPRFDLPGFMLTSAALVALLAGLEGLSGPHRVLSGLTVLAGMGLGAIAARPLSRREGPLLDLSPLKIPTFTISTVDAGNLFRLTISATPFLLPLMFQVAFGLSAWMAGLYVFAYFAGNLLMKTVLPQRADRQRRACWHRDPGLRRPRAHDVGRACGGRPVGCGPHAIDAIHRAGYADLRRCRAPSSGFLIDAIQHAATGFDWPGRQPRRGPDQCFAESQGRRPPGARRLSPRLPRDGADLHRGKRAVPAPGRRRGRRGERPSTQPLNARRARAAPHRAQRSARTPRQGSAGPRDCSAWPGVGCR